MTVTKDQIEWAAQYGTAQQHEILCAEYEGRPIRDVTTLGGAMVPLDQIQPAARPIQDAIVPPGVNPEMPDPDSDTPIRENDAEVERYEDWSKKDLAAEAKVRGLDSNQNKDPLIVSLRADDAAFEAAQSE